MSVSWPSFAELPVRAGAPAGAAWGVFGDRDDVGTLNFIDAPAIVQASRCVMRGEVFSLNWDVSLPQPAFYGRSTCDHTILEKYDGAVVDDFVDGLWLQGSSQWDGLRHISDAVNGERRFYDGCTLAEVMESSGPRLGIEHWARRGIAGRGVVVDVARYCAEHGPAYDPLEHFLIERELLEATLAHQGVTLRAGDILMLRTGWIDRYSELSDDDRQELAGQLRPGSAGLGLDGIAELLWDSRIAAIGADNPALEASHLGRGGDLDLHRALIARLGMAIGELWDLRALAADCASDGVFESFVVAAPMHLHGAVGSPANATAIK